MAGLGEGSSLRVDPVPTSGPGPVEGVIHRQFACLAARLSRRGCRDHQSHLTAQPWSLSLGIGPREAAGLRAPGGAEEERGSRAPEDVRARRTPSSPPRPLLTCAPRGPATATTLRATRSPAASTKAAAIFPSAAGTCHRGQHSGSAARRRWGCQGAGERQPLAPPAAGSESCHSIGSHSWPCTLPHSPEGGSVHSIGSAAEIFSAHWLLLPTRRFFHSIGFF